MSDVAGVLFRRRGRVSEIASVLRRYGFARLAANASAAAGSPESNRRSYVVRRADPALVEMTTGARLRSALAELGTTWIKFGQMLSLRPDLVGTDVADELASLQTSVPADPPGSAERCIEESLGMSVDAAFGSFETTPLASGSVAQVHRATLKDGTSVAVKVLHDGAAERVLADLELMRALARFVEDNDPEIARYAPTTLVAEFDVMMRGAIDLTQELSSLQRFTANFADEPDVIIPRPYPEQSSRSVLTMQMLSGRPFADPDALRRDGWDVEAMTRRASDIYLEMVFRDGLYHADPHPGNFLLPDPQHIAILDFGDVGRLTGARKRQLQDLLVAVSQKDADALTDAVVEITAAPSELDLDALRNDVETWTAENLAGSVAELDTAAMLRSGANILRNHRLTFPSDLALLFRVLLRLQGLGQQLGTDASLTDLLDPWVRQMTAERFDPRRLAHRVARTARSWDRLITSLPEDLGRVLAQLRAGTVAVEFKVHDTDRLVPQIVDGMLAAASLLAASQLLSRRTSPVVGGVSVPGLLSVTVGVVTWHRLQLQRPGYRRAVTQVLQLMRPKR